MRQRNPRGGFRFALVLTALMATATSAWAQDKVTITFANWADAENATRPGIEKIIQDFEKSHPTSSAEPADFVFGDCAATGAARACRQSARPAELAGNDTILLALTGKLEPLDGFVGAQEMAALKPVVPGGPALDTAN